MRQQPLRGLGHLVNNPTVLSPTSSGTPTSTTQAQHGHPALEMSFRNLPLDSILEGKHGQARLLWRPSGAPYIPFLGEVLTASLPGWQKA